MTAIVELGLVVQASMSVEEAHAICDRIEAPVEAALPGARAMIHVEPGRLEERDASI